MSSQHPIPQEAHITYQLDPKTRKMLKKIENANKLHNVIIRAVISGIVTVLFFSLGFAGLIAVFVRAFQHFPIIDKFLQETKIAVIEEQSNSATNITDCLVGSNGTSVNNNEQTQNPIKGTSNFSSKNYDLVFKYPSYFQNVTEYGIGDNNKGQESYMTVFESSGTLSKMTIYINPEDFRIEGEYTSEQVQTESNETINVQIYRNGAKVYSKEESVPILYLQYIKGDNTYNFVAKADDNTFDNGKSDFVEIVKTIK
jgi:hypothetical protein